MDRQREGHGKNRVYRVWTPGRRNPESNNAFTSKPNVANDDKISNADFGNLGPLDRSAETFSEYDPSLLTNDIASPEKVKNTDLSRVPPQATESNLPSSNSQEILIASKDTFPEAEPDLVSMEMETNLVPSETSIASKPLSSESNQRYPCLPLTVENVRREKWIRERLQVSSMNECFCLKLLFCFIWYPMFINLLI